MQVMNWLPLLVALLMAAALVAQQLAHHKQTEMWMRSFLDKQGVPMHIMDGEPPEAIVKSQPVPRKRISVPIPGVSWRKS